MGTRRRSARFTRAGLLAAYKGLVSDRALGAPNAAVNPRVWTAWLARSHASTFVARSEGAVVGFCTLQAAPSSEGPGKVGEIPVIVVKPSHWGRGVGRALFERVLEEARESGLDEVVLWVLESNSQARRFYQSLGFVPEGKTRTFHERGGERVQELLYRRSVADAPV